MHEIVQMGDIVVDKIPSIDNLTDPFIKTLIEKAFYGHRDTLGVRCVPSMLLEA